MFRKIKVAVAVIITVLLFSACGKSDTAPPSATISSADTSAEDIMGELFCKFDNASAEYVDADFLDFLQKEYGEECLKSIRSALFDGSFTLDSWHDITGNTLTVLKAVRSGALDKNSPGYNCRIREIGNNDGTTVIRITGDLSFADNWYIMPVMDKRNKGISGILSDETVSLLKNADITLVNNEFCYSDRGSPLPSKMYTFRASPERAALLGELGIDIVSLANNHAYDFGADAFRDTMKTLNNVCVPYIGGGRNLDEAMKPYYFIVDGRMYAFTAATKAEKHKLTPEATESEPGVLRTYDPEKYIEVIKEAAQNSDYSVAYVHWGLEGSHRIENGLREMGLQFIDAGADIVVGSHAHLLQGIEFYDGKPIVYNLGNFLFNKKTMDTGILELSIINGNPEYKFIPCVQSDCYTETVHGEEEKRILDFMKSLSNGVVFGTDGVFAEGEKYAE